MTNQLKTLPSPLFSQSVALSYFLLTGSGGGGGHRSRAAFLFLNDSFFLRMSCQDFTQALWVISKDYLCLVGISNRSILRTVKFIFSSMLLISKILMVYLSMQHHCIRNASHISLPKQLGKLPYIGLHQQNNEMTASRTFCIIFCLYPKRSTI